MFSHSSTLCIALIRCSLLSSVGVPLMHHTIGYVSNLICIQYYLVPFSSKFSKYSFAALTNSLFGSDGFANIVASGGTSSYTYLWSSGGTTSIETGLSAGFYNVTITDINGCTNSFAVISLTNVTAKKT